MRRLRLVFGASSFSTTRSSCLPGSSSATRRAAPETTLTPGHAAQRRHEVEVRQRRGQRAQRLGRVARRGGEPAGEQLQAAGDAVARPAGLGRRDLAPLGLQVHERDEDLRAGQPVEGGVVDLAQQPDLRPVLDAVDEVHLPQRAAAIEPALEDARALLGQLAQVARSGQRDLADVVVEVDVRLLDPERVVEAERDLDQAPAERRQQVQALAQHRAQAADGDDAAGRGRGVVHGQAADVAVGPVVLERQELGVEARELSHGSPLRRPIRGAPLSCPRAYPSGTDAAIVVFRSAAGPGA